MDKTSEKQKIMQKTRNLYSLIIMLASFSTIVGCSSYPASYNENAHSYDEPYTMSSISYYACSSNLSPYDGLDVKLPEEPSCTSTVITSSKRQSIANYNQCLKDLKEYAGQLDQWVICKNNKVFEYAKQREKRAIDVFNTTIQEARQHIENKQSSVEFYPSQIMDESPIVYKTCSFTLIFTDPCSYQIPFTPLCLQYNGFDINKPEACLHDLQSWQSNLKDWTKKQSEANIEIAKNILKKLIDKLRLQGSFL